MRKCCVFFLSVGFLLLPSTPVGGSISPFKRQEKAKEEETQENWHESDINVHEWLLWSHWWCRNVPVSLLCSALTHVAPRKRSFYFYSCFCLLRHFLLRAERSRKKVGFSPTSQVILCCLQASLLEGRSDRFIWIVNVKIPTAPRRFFEGTHFSAKLHSKKWCFIEGSYFSNA